MNMLVQEMTERLCEEDSIMVSNFGTFETKKRMERVIISPTTGGRMLVPPKIVVGFKQSNNMSRHMLAMKRNTKPIPFAIQLLDSAINFLS